MGPKSLVSLIIGLVLVLVASSSLYIVNETERAIKLKFNAIVEADIPPGIHFKIPVIEEVRKFDGRILTLDSRPERFLTKGKKFVIVDSFVKWRIKDVKAYYSATGGGDRFSASNLLASLSNRGLRDEFARRTLQEVVSGERDELMADITKSLNIQTQAEFGIEVLDMRVKGIDLPEELSKNVYSRMSTEREREAREYRSQGKEAAEGIKADADRQKVVLEAQAYRDAERTRGEGDAIAAATYAKAFNKDSEFYSFTRSLKAYKDTFGADDGNVLMLKPDSDFFKYMKQPTAK